MDISFNRYASLQPFKAMTVSYNEEKQTDVATAQKSVEDLKYRSSDGKLRCIDKEDSCTIFFDRDNKERDFMLELFEKGINFKYFVEKNNSEDEAIDYNC